MKHLKKHGFLILAFLWTCVIFGFSLQNGTESLITSNIVLDLLAKILPLLKDPAHLKLVILIIRKTAHFSEYFILGVIYSRAYRENKFQALLLIGCFIPVIDEGIQLFSPGRTSSPIDMMIDLSGYLLALIVLGSIPILLGLVKPKAPIKK